MRYRIFVILTGLLFEATINPAFSGLPADSLWTLEKDKNAVKVFTRKAEDVDFKEFRAVTIVQASIPALVALVKDVESYPEWVENVKSSKLLEVINDNEEVYYNEIKVPWPLSNRDNIVAAKIVKDTESGIVRIIMKGKPDYIPEKSGLVRIPVARGFWEFVPLGNGETKVTLQYLADPGGNVPAWIVNMFVVDGPYKTFLNMKELLKKEF